MLDSGVGAKRAEKLERQHQIRAQHRAKDETRAIIEQSRRQAEDNARNARTAALAAIHPLLPLKGKSSVLCLG